MSSRRTITAITWSWPRPSPARSRRTLRPQRAEHVRERHEVGELVAGAILGELGVIAVLLAAAGVTSRGLHVTGRVGGDPHVGPRRRHGELADALHRLARRATASPVVDVAEPLVPRPADAGLVVAAEAKVVLHGRAVPAPCGDLNRRCPRLEETTAPKERRCPLPGSPAVGSFRGAASFRRGHLTRRRARRRRAARSCGSGGRTR